LGVGITPPNPSDLLCSPALPAFLFECRQRYDHVVIDTPPLNLVSDALSIAEHCDRIVLVVRDVHTTRRSIREALERLDPMRGKLLGFVLNAARDLTARKKDYLYKEVAASASASA
jgi:Mrp family chromosome partitioning ATPase